MACEQSGRRGRHLAGRAIRGLACCSRSAPSWRWRIAIAIVWGLLRFVFRIPSLVSVGAQSRRREKGFQALSRGMLAVGAGDARGAAKHAYDANRLIGHEPMTKLLQAQSAQLAGDRPRAVAAYNAMLDHHETHGIGLRGLHVEARRAGDHAAALQYAMRAHARAPASWAGQAVLDDRTRRGDWAGALATVDSNAGARLIDKPTANRWRAVIKTAMAEEAMERDPKARSLSRRRPASSRRRSCPRRRSAAGSPRRPATIVARAACSKPLTRRRPIPISPRPICASATAIRPRTGWRAPGRLRAWRRSIPNRLSRWGAPRLMRTILSAARAAIAPAHRLGFVERPPDPARLPIDGRHRGDRGQSRRGARVAWPRSARPARQGLGGGWGHQRPLGAGLAVGNARRLRLAHA